MTRVLSVSQWLSLRESAELAGRTLGFVPTMGALHAGHVALFSRAKAENDLCLASIFVNPTQFNDPKDLEKYPRTFEADLALLRAAGVDFLLYPESGELYPDDYRYRISETELSGALCGAHRPGHFEGVLTVVLKLLNLAQADRAYFGEKDFQQLKLVEGMARAFFLRTEIIGCPTVREADGLAMSSRNQRLSAAERARAARFAEILRSPEHADAIRARLEAEGFAPEYVEERFGRRLAAVRVGEVRLIDNVAL